MLAGALLLFGIFLIWIGVTGRGRKFYEAVTGMILEPPTTQS
jgi:hypothetical protein